MLPKIGVLTIGDELLNGERADTNTARIGRILQRQGLAIWQSVTVGDVEPDMEEALLHLAGRCGIVLVTGGLGPTADDLTARAAAHSFRRRLMMNEEALTQIRNHFAARGRPLHPANEKQALLPQKALVLPNRLGTAPGFHLHHGGKNLFFMPGVPEEMEAMLEEIVLPQILERSGHPEPAHRAEFQVFGLSEPKVEEELRQAGLPGDIRLAFGVDFPLVGVKLRAPTAAALAEARTAVRRRLAAYLVAEENGSLERTVADLLRASGNTLALAESCTGGMIAARLTALPGTSEFLDRAAVTYSNRAKADWLQVPVDLIEKQGAVSRECALAMARGARRTSGCDIALAVTGIAGPTGGSPEKPVGTVFLALAAADTERVKGFRFPGDRQRVRLWATYMGLDWLRRHLQRPSPPS